MIFFKHTVINDEVVKFEAIENESIIGRCTLVMKDSVADVAELSYNETAPYAVEGLLRSAYNYAGLRNYYLAKCTAKNIDSFLSKMNFQKNDSEYLSDIPTILTGSCCK